MPVTRWLRCGRGGRQHDGALEGLAADGAVADELGARLAHGAVAAGPRATSTLGSDMQMTHLRAARSSGGGSALQEQIKGIISSSASSPRAMPCSHAVRVAKLGCSCGRCAQHARMTPCTASGHPAGWSRRPPQ